MTDGDSITQLAVVVLLLALAVPALATAHEYAGTPIEYEESVTVDYGSSTNVSENSTVEGYSENITITDNGTTLNEGEDYDWNATSGKIQWIDGPNSNDGDAAVVEYAAYQRTPETALAWTIITPFFGLFGLFGLVSAIRALWQFTAELWEL